MPASAASDSGPKSSSADVADEKFKGLLAAVKAVMDVVAGSPNLPAELQGPLATIKEFTDPKPKPHSHADWQSAKAKKENANIRLTKANDELDKARAAATTAEEAAQEAQKQYEEADDWYRKVDKEWKALDPDGQVAPSAGQQVQATEKALAEAAEVQVPSDAMDVDEIENLLGKEAKEQMEAIRQHEAKAKEQSAQAKEQNEVKMAEKRQLDARIMEAKKQKIEVPAAEKSG